MPHDLKISTKIRSSNQNNKKYIMMHYTVSNFENTIEIFKNPQSNVSAHYVIDKDVNEKNEQIYEIVDPRDRAWHAGVGSWKNVTEMNALSVGIEHINTGAEKYTDSQMKSTTLLVDNLVSAFLIDPKNIIGHSDFAPSRKIDPGPYFPWKKLFEADKHYDRLDHPSFGIYHNLENLDPNKAQVVAQYNPSSASSSENTVRDKESDAIVDLKEVQNGLQKLGYKVNVNGEFDKDFNYVVRAFTSHYYPEAIFEKIGFDKYYGTVNNGDALLANYFWDTNHQEMLGQLLDQN